MALRPRHHNDTPRHLLSSATYQRHMRTSITIHHAAAQSQRQRQRPPVLVLRYCPRPPRRHLAARNTKGTGARPQPRTMPPPRPAPAPCPARPALLLAVFVVAVAEVPACTNTNIPRHNPRTWPLRIPQRSRCGGFIGRRLRPDRPCSPCRWRRRHRTSTGGRWRWRWRWLWAAAWCMAVDVRMCLWYVALLGGVGCRCGAWV